MASTAAGFRKAPRPAAIPQAWLNPNLLASTSLCMLPFWLAGVLSILVARRVGGGAGGFLIALILVATAGLGSFLVFGAVLGGLVFNLEAALLLTGLLFACVWRMAGHASCPPRPGR